MQDKKQNKEISNAPVRQSNHHDGKISKEKPPKKPSLNKPEKAMILGNRFVDKKDIIWFNQDFFTYKDGVWESLDYESIRAMIASEYIREFGAMKDSELREVIMFMKTRTYSTYKDAVERIYGEKKDEWVVNLNSGRFNVKYKLLNKYRREDLIFYKLPLDYKEEIDVPVDFFRLLTTSMGYEWDFEKTRPAPLKKGEQVEFNRLMCFIQEWLGYSLTPGNPLHRNLIMYGSGRNGKGVLQEVWSAMLGNENVSKLDLKYINDPVMIGQTKNKLVNFSYDLDSGQQLDSGIVKAAAAGEWVTGRELYKNPSEFRFTAKLVIACNELPYVRNMGPAIQERFFILPFNKQFDKSERDPYLKDRIIENELDDIFSWAVKGLARLMERGEFDVPEICQAEAKHFQGFNDSVDNFLEEEDLVGQLGDKTKRSVVWRAFKAYCFDSAIKQIPKSRFFEIMRKKGYDTIKNRGDYYFKGIKAPENSTIEDSL